MTEPINDLPRPELCRTCETGWACIRADYIECVDKRELWDAGYAAGKAAAGEESTPLAASLKRADQVRRDAEEVAANAFKSRDLWKSKRDHWMQRAEAAEAKLDDLSRELTAEIEAHRETRQRAAAAEGKLEATQRCLRAEADARIAYQDKLAELVRRVRGVLAGMGYTAPIHAILDEYDKPGGAMTYTEADLERVRNSGAECLCDCDTCVVQAAKLIAEARAEATAAERDRCAKIAGRMCVIGEARNIAAEIRREP